MDTDTTIYATHSNLWLAIAGKNVTGIDVPRAVYIINVDLLTDCTNYTCIYIELYTFL